LPFARSGSAIWRADHCSAVERNVPMREASMNIPGRIAIVSAAALGIAAQAGQAQHIRVESATYGANCGAATGNVTRDLARRCNERETCRYVVKARPARTPHASCAADFITEWSCDHREFHRAMLSAEAGNGSALMLTCVPATGAGK
jgi:hypothetical protein